MTDYIANDLDRSRLSLPKLVDDDYDTIEAERLAALKAGYEARGLGWDTGQTKWEPGVILEQHDADREQRDRRSINDAVKAWSIDDTWGEFLDVLGAGVFCIRRVIGTDANGNPVMEEDEEYRRRIKLAPATLSQAAPGNYEYFASSVHPEIKHARIVGIDGPRINLALLGRYGDGTPSAGAVAAVHNYVYDAANHAKLGTDVPQFTGAGVLTYQIAVHLLLPRGPSKAAAIAEATTRLQAMADRRHLLGASVGRDRIQANALVAGAEAAVILSPAADIKPTLGEVAYCTDIAVTAEVVDV
ncbi:phage-related baseplate assembly protein [Rhodobium orientis]|uniref:Uncharacterized protein n=1 Tax=Rhodobium orientis TaxID=34017 RepID=A0A327JML8_9HYPH|nr:baseplate J/gp47 family protein [Rhodobium orientis]MBB4302355.1 phage-related baseplate assembly protein [Rhodobium orientis]MBK5949060.1 hypothetical protein [Rhodobium orientis]RAI26613.1 hypothetical protein CH339_13510 [Rhodobium orientis]